MLICSGTVSVSRIVPGFLPTIVENHSSFVARKKQKTFLLKLNKFPDLKVCDFGLSPLPMQTTLLKFSFGMKYLFIHRISKYLLHFLQKISYYIIS